MNMKKIFKNTGRLFQRLEVGGIIGLFFSVLSIPGVTQTLNIQFKNLWDIGRFVLALFIIAIVVFIFCQIVGGIFTWIGEYGEKIDFERDPKDDYYNDSNKHKIVGVWVVNNTNYDLTDCWVELKAIDNYPINRHNQVLLWKAETTEKITIVAGDRKFLNVAEEDDMFVSFRLSKGNARYQSYPSDKGTYYRLNLKIVLALKGKIDDVTISPREFYGEISYQTVPPPLVTSYLGGTPVYPSYGSVIKLEKIKSWKSISRK